MVSGGSLRNTPACAGKTESCKFSSLNHSETPPLARGRLPVLPWHDYRQRNTPACAGKTPSIRAGRNTPAETPPLARGRLEDRKTLGAASGNTPACAGKTRAKPSTRSMSRKHPRLRGEDEHASRGNAPRLETPPLARGRRILQILVAEPLRNTPACAGKTRISTAKLPSDRKHPRLRGEDPPASAGIRPFEETPPLARGRQWLKAQAEEDAGNTPACAGKTLWPIVTARAI